MPSVIDLAISGKREDAERELSDAPDPSPKGCWRAPLSIARTHGEVLIGGNETPHVLQLLCCSKASESTESLDVMASILSAEDGASVIDVRGRDTAKLVGRFWEHYPAAALLLRSDKDGFEYAMGEGVDGPLDLAAAQSLARQGGRIFLPPPSLQTRATP